MENDKNMEDIANTLEQDGIKVVRMTKDMDMGALEKLIREAVGEEEH